MVDEQKNNEKLPSLLERGIDFLIGLENKGLISRMDTVEILEPDIFDISEFALKRLFDEKYLKEVEKVYELNGKCGGVEKDGK